MRVTETNPWLKKCWRGGVGEIGGGWGLVGRGSTQAVSQAGLTPVAYIISWTGKEFICRFLRTPYILWISIMGQNRFAYVNNAKGT